MVMGTLSLLTALAGPVAVLMAAMVALHWLLPCIFSAMVLVGKVVEALCDCVWIGAK